MTATPLLIKGPVDVDIMQALAAAAPFKGLSSAVLKAIADIAETRRYATGETVFAPDQQEADEILFVISGQVRASSGDPHSGAVFVEEIGEGGFLGLAEAVLGSRSAFLQGLTVEAGADTDLAVLGAEEFRTLVAQRPSLTRSLMLYFADIAARSGDEEQVGSSLRRVLSALMEYIERDPISGEWRVPRMPKHRELAEKAGAAETDAANAVARLIQEGVARREYPGLIIDNMTLFNQMAG